MDDLQRCARCLWWVSTRNLSLTSPTANWRHQRRWQRVALHWNLVKQQLEVAYDFTCIDGASFNYRGLQQGHEQWASWILLESDTPSNYVLFSRVRQKNLGYAKGRSGHTREKLGRIPKVWYSRHHWVEGESSRGRKHPSLNLWRGPRDWEKSCRKGLSIAAWTGLTWWRLYAKLHFWNDRQFKRYQEYALVRYLVLGSWQAHVWIPVRSLLRLHAISARFCSKHVGENHVLRRLYRNRVRRPEKDFRGLLIVEAYFFPISSDAIQ